MNTTRLKLLVCQFCPCVARYLSVFHCVYGSRVFLFQTNSVYLLLTLFFCTVLPTFLLISVSLSLSHLTYFNVFCTVLRTNIKILLLFLTRLVLWSLTLSHCPIFQAGWRVTVEGQRKARSQHVGHHVIGKLLPISATQTRLVQIGHLPRRTRRFVPRFSPRKK